MFKQMLQFAPLYGGNQWQAHLPVTEALIGKTALQVRVGKNQSDIAVLKEAVFLCFGQVVEKKHLSPWRWGILKKRGTPYTDQAYVCRQLICMA